MGLTIPVLIVKGKIKPDNRTQIKEYDAINIDVLYNLKK